jgi:hypothetical protein
MVQPEPERTMTGAKETSAKRKPFWTSTAFSLPFLIFAVLGTVSAWRSYFVHWDGFRWTIESTVGMLIAVLVGLISCGIASLVSKFRKRE